MLRERQTCAPAALCSQGPSQEDPGATGAQAPAWGPVRKSLHLWLHSRTLHPTIHRSPRCQAHRQKAQPCVLTTNKRLQEGSHHRCHSVPVTDDLESLSPPCKGGCSPHFTEEETAGQGGHVKKSGSKGTNQNWKHRLVLTPKLGLCPPPGLSQGEDRLAVSRA